MNKINYKKRTNCRLCGSKSINSVLKLNDTPPANNFVTLDLINEEQQKFPLELFFCDQCAHVQLPYVLDPACLFEDYVYVSGTSPVFIEHFKNYAETIINKYSPDPENIILDIGSNDGTFLSFFKDQNFDVVGVDPAQEISKEANLRGIATINSFFDFDLSKKLVQDFSKASIVTANNVFAHADDLKGIIDAVKNVLAEEGLFIFEVSYLVDVFQKSLFDTIYHEHLAYHSVKPLKNFFEINGMELIDVERIETHGGSLRGVVQKIGGQRKINKSVSDLIVFEEKIEIDQKRTFENFSKKINFVKNKLKSLLFSLKDQGKKIAAFGAPAKATTLMYQFELNKNIIDFIIDDNPLKQNKFSPGLHIPVLSSDAIEKYKPDYLLILAWNFSEPIINKNKLFLDNGGHFIVPLPEVKII